MDIGYSAPPLKLTAQGIDMLDEVTLQTEGYEPSGYWKWFNETGAGRVLDAHVGSYFLIRAVTACCEIMA